MMAGEFEIARQGTLEEVKQTVNDTKTTIGDIGDPAGEESLVGLVKKIPESVPTGAVKSIQTIIVNEDDNIGQDKEFAQSYYKDYAISPVNIEKSIVLAFSSCMQSKGANVCARFINASTVRIYVSTEVVGIYKIKGVCAQIVEFF